jgi:CSLREA domain-containing protein
MYASPVIKSTVVLLLIQHATAATLTVNTTADEFNAGGSCSVREAIQAANTNQNFGGCVGSGSYGLADIINVPAGNYLLTRYGSYNDSNTSGDFDIAGNVRIVGAGAPQTVIRGDGESDRIFHILSGNVTIEGMILRDGFMVSGNAGGGIRSEPGSISTLNRLVIGPNTADGNGCDQPHSGE